MISYPHWLVFTKKNQHLLGHLYSKEHPCGYVLRAHFFGGFASKSGNPKKPLVTNHPKRGSVGCSDSIDQVIERGSAVHCVSAYEGDIIARNGLFSIEEQPPSPPRKGPNFRWLWVYGKALNQHNHGRRQGRLKWVCLLLRVRPFWGCWETKGEKMICWVLYVHTPKSLAEMCT